MAAAMDHQQEWTPIRGLQRALVGTVWRSVIALVIWGALVWFATPFLNIAPMHWAWFAMLALLLSVPGVAIGHGLSKGLIGRAGFVSSIVSAIPIVCAWVLVYAGVEIAGMFRELETWRPMFTTGVTGLFAMIWIIKATIVDA